MAVLKEFRIQQRAPFQAFKGRNLYESPRLNYGSDLFYYATISPCFKKEISFCFIAGRHKKNGNLSALVLVVRATELESA